MHRFFLAFLLILGLAISANAGPNAGGTLLVHATPTTVYTDDSTGYCGLSDVASGCEGLITNLPSAPETTHVWWVTAAFPPSSSPRVKGVVFGVDYDADGIILVDWATCGDLELAWPGWPNPLSGVAVTWLVTQQTHLLEVYWFAGYEYSGRDLTFRMTISPTQGGQFADDAVPSNTDPIADFGQLGFGGDPGYLPCPEAIGACCLGDGSCELRPRADCAGEWLGSNIACDPAPCTLGACCLDTGQCRILDAAECGAAGGVHQGAFTSCDPEPCAGVAGACCLPGGSCQISSEVDCHLEGGTFVWAGTTCDPNPCERALYELADDGSGDLPTIQSAINAAADGAVIELLNGTYTGLGNCDVDFLGKAVTVRSQSGDPELCVIDCQGLGRGFVFVSGESRASILREVTVRNGRGGGGGGIYVRSSSPLVSGCVFSECSALRGGAVFVEQSGALIEACGFLRNTADYTGGAAHVEGGDGGLTVRGSWFFENAARGGGGLSVNGRADLEGCTLWKNSAEEGGALLVVAILGLANCTLAENTADFGSAVFASYSVVSIERSILASNRGGSLITCSNSGFELSCCDVFGNDGGDYAGCLAGQGGVRGNISRDPLFCDASTGDLRLQPGSPCLPNPWSTVSSCRRMGAHGAGCGLLVSGRSASAQVEPPAGTEIASLALVHPNPSTGEITISLQIGAPSRVLVDLYDVFGRRIIRMVDESLEPGTHTFERNFLEGSTQDLPAGVYYVRMSDGRSTKDQRIVLVR